MMEEDKKNSHLNRALRKIDSQAKFQVDEQLAQFRHWWEQWDEGQRIEFKAWIYEFVKVKSNKPNVPPYLSISLTFHEGEEGPSFSPPPRSIQKAIEHWERGEAFAPTTISDLCE